MSFYSSLVLSIAFGNSPLVLNKLLNSLYRPSDLIPSIVFWNYDKYEWSNTGSFYLWYIRYGQNFFIAPTDSAGN